MCRSRLHLLALLISLAAWAPMTSLAATMTQGSAVVTKPGDQGALSITSDSAGGAFVLWRELWAATSDANDLYVQHVLPSGRVDATWPAGGCAFAPGQYEQTAAGAIPDGQGGVFIAFNSTIGGSAATFPLVQHVLATGVRDPRWPASGNPVGGGAPTYGSPPSLLSDGAGGVIVAYADGNNVGAHRIRVDGTTPAGWPRAWNTGAYVYPSPSAVSDGKGGAFVGWLDSRVGSNRPYAHHVLSDGTSDPRWPTTGLPLSPTGYSASRVSMIADASGGALFVWSNGVEVIAQRIDSAGTVVSPWPADGRVLGSGASTYDLKVLSDGPGGALVVWQDARSGNKDIYAQRVLADGSIGAG